MSSARHSFHQGFKPMQGRSLFSYTLRRMGPTSTHFMLVALHMMMS